MEHGKFYQTAKEIGLPSLPSGYFWRIKPDDVTITVQLRRKLLLGSFPLYISTIFPQPEESPDDVADTIINSAKFLHTAFMGTRSRKDLANSIKGDFY